MVGAAGFELATYGTQNRRATRLRYAPTAAPLPAAEGNEKPSLRSQGGGLSETGASTASPAATIRAMPMQVGRSGISPKKT